VRGFHISISGKRDMVIFSIDILYERADILSLFPLQDLSTVIVGFEFLTLATFRKYDNHLYLCYYDPYKCHCYTTEHVIKDPFCVKQ